MSFCNLSFNTRFQNKNLYSNDWHFNQKLHQVFLIYILYNIRELLAAIFTNLVIHAQILLLKKCFYSFLRYLKFEMLMDTENRCKVTKAHWVRRVRWAKKKTLNIPTHVSFLIKVLSMPFIPMSALIHVRYF